MPDQPLNEREELFLQSLRDVLPQFRLHSDKQLTKKIGKDRLDDLSLQFFAYIETGAGELKKNEKLALASQCWRCIIKYIRNVNTPVTFESLLNSIQFISTAMDESFPGYASAKLLSWTIRQVA